MGHEHAADNIYHICIIICATVVTYNEPNSKMLVHQVDPLDSGFLQDGRGREGETEGERERGRRVGGFGGTNGDGMG